jgi:Rho-binding antiterminator
MTTPSPYTPVGCGFYDVLEAAAVRKTTIQVRYLTPEGRETEYQGRILDVFARGSEEFVRMEGDREVRLDRLIEVDGVKNAACRTTGNSGTPPLAPGDPG